MFFCMVARVLYNIKNKVKYSKKQSYLYHDFWKITLFACTFVFTNSSHGTIKMTTNN